MLPQLSMKLVDDFEKGQLSRRELAAQLIGLGAAMAVVDNAAAQTASSAETESATFQAKRLDHIALNVTDVARSRDFYAQHLGLEPRRQGERNCFMAPADSEFILALFQSEQPGMNHYCYGIDDYDAEAVVEKLIAARLAPRREGNRVYFPDPDGITVQLAAREN